MSSILDALKKLEEEKAEAARATTVEFEDDSGEQDLIRGGKRRQMTISYSPVALAAIVAVVALSVAGVYYAFRHGGATDATVARVSTAAVPAVAQPPAPVPAQPAAPMPVAQTPAQPAQIAPQPAAAPAQVTPSAPQPVAPATPVPPPAPVALAQPQPTAPAASVPVAPAATAPVVPVSPSSVVPVTAPQTTVASMPGVVAPPIVPAPRIAKASQEPALKPVETVAPRGKIPPVSPASKSIARSVTKSADDELPDPTKEVKTAAAPSVKTTPSTDSLDMYSLPILTESDKSRLGLKGMEVNMLRSPNKNRPSPSAVINMQPVYVNETIEGTKAKLIGVDVRGIAIEVGGERFFVRR